MSDSEPQVMNKREICRFWGVTKSYIDSKIKEVLTVIHDIDEQDILQKLNDCGMDIEKVVLDLLETNISNHNEPISDKEMESEVLTTLHSHPMIGPIESVDGSTWCCDNTKCTKNRRHRAYKMPYFKSKELDDEYTLCDTCVRTHSKESTANPLIQNTNINNINNSDGNNNIKKKRNRKRKRENVEDEHIFIKPLNKRRKLIRNDKENQDMLTEMIVSILDKDKELNRDKLLCKLNKKIAENNESKSSNWRRLYQSTLGKFDEFIMNNDRFNILKQNKRNFSVELNDDSEDQLNDDNHNKRLRSPSSCLSSVSPPSDDSADSTYSLSESNSPTNNAFALSRSKKNCNSKQERDSDDEPDPTTNNSASFEKKENSESDRNENDEEKQGKKKTILKKKKEIKIKKKKPWKQKMFNPLKIKYNATPIRYDENKHSSWQKDQFTWTVNNIKPLKDINDLYRLQSTSSSWSWDKYQVKCEYDKTYICDDKAELESLYNCAFNEIHRKSKKPTKKKNELQQYKIKIDYTIQANIKKTKDITKKSEKESKRYSAEIEFSLNRLQKTGNCFVVDIPATIALTARSQELIDDIMESIHIKDEFSGKGHQSTSISLLDFACRYDDKETKPFQSFKQCKICYQIPMKNEKTLPCGHKFCRKCVWRHFVDDAEEECPVCEHEFDSSEVALFVDWNWEFLDDENEHKDDEETFEEGKGKERIAEEQKKYGLNVTAFPYQVQSIEWMVQRETDEEGLYKYLFRKGQFKNGEVFYYSAVLKRLVLADELPIIHGGFLCEEMGLGKTVECLAVIHCNRRKGEYSTSKTNVVALKEAALRRKRVEVKQKEDANEDMYIMDNINGVRRKKKKKIYKFVEETKEYTYYGGKGTLIIGPVSLIGQWEHEVDTRSNGDLSYKRYYGQRSRNIKHYLDYDIIFTTFGVLAKEDGNDRRNHVLHRIQWHRIILDESHYIKNGAARTSININELKANSKWLLSGTPFERPSDLVNQLKFIGIEQQYLNAMQLKDNYVYSKALIKSVKYMMMRHKKGQKFNNKPILTMPEKEEDIMYVEFDAKQKEYYDKLYATAKETFDFYKATGNTSRGYIPILSSLHPARQACSGYIASITSIEEQLSAAQESTHKIRAMVQRNRNKSSKELYALARVEAYNKDGQCVICLECPPDNPLQTLCRHIFCGECIRAQLEANGECPICRKQTTVKQLKLPPSQKQEDDDNHNNNHNDEQKDNDDDEDEHKDNDKDENTIKFDAKLKVLVSSLNKLRVDRPCDKSLIFTSFSKSLDWICCELERNNIKYSTLTGSMTMNKRAQNLKRFSNDPSVKVFVLTVRTGAVGLTLTSANHVFMMEPTFNPALHRQAINRVYRLGQEKKVFIHTLIMKDSIEQRIWNINKDKQKGDIDNKTNKNMYGNIKDDKAGALQNTEIEKLFQIDDEQQNDI